MLGWELDPRKSAGMCDSIFLLGCDVCVGPREVTWPLGFEKASAWVHELRLILDPGSMSQAVAY
eukprot:6531570-Pyramimonas_sp.AAC.1